MEMTREIPRIFLNRINKLMDVCHNEDNILKSTLTSNNIAKLSQKPSNCAGDIPAEQYWRQEIVDGPFSTDIQIACEDRASRSWIDSEPKGWSGRDYVRAIQQRTANLPTRGIPSNPPDQQKCRSRCDANETICHILQKCPTTHWERIARHSEFVDKITKHCKTKNWPIEQEPNVRCTDGRLYKLDLIIHLPENRTVITDVQVSWEGRKPIQEIYNAKKYIYDNHEFREAGKKRWPNKDLIFAPVILGARGLWPRANREATELLGIEPPLRSSCVQSTLKWGSSIHAVFMRGNMAANLHNGEPTDNSIIDGSAEITPSPQRRWKCD